MCGMPLSTSHVLHNCPLHFVTVWHLYVNLCLLIPFLNPCWHHCVPTPWDVAVKTTKRSLLMSDQTTKSILFPHERFHISVTGEVTSQSIHTATEHEATKLMLVQLSGAVITTWYKIQHQGNMLGRMAIYTSDTIHSLLGYSCIVMCRGYI